LTRDILDVEYDYIHILSYKGANEQPEDKVEKAENHRISYDCPPLANPEE
jgi:hypothetical protein